MASRRRRTDAAATPSLRLPVRAVACLGLAALVASAVGCFPNPPEDDEGHATYAREIFPILLGRRARGVDEVEVVADIAQLFGRATAAKMLMKDRQYVEHWSAVLADLLQVQRDGSGTLAAQDSSCWGEPTRDDPDPAIATWVRDHGPEDAGAPTPAWNMTDLVRSAVLIDDLSPLYRANLFPLSMRRRGAGGVNGRSSEVAQRFLQVYLHRDVTCLRCHNPDFSTSNKTDASGDIVWRRLWAVPGHPEKALFGDFNDAAATLARLRSVMRADVRNPVGSGTGIQPWGMVDECARDSATASPANAPATFQGFRHPGGSDPSLTNAGFASIDGSSNPLASLWELEVAFRNGVQGLEDGYTRSEPVNPSETPFCRVIPVFSGYCTGCHPDSGGLDLSGDLAVELVNAPTEAASSVLPLRVVPGNLALSELARRIRASASDGRMPPGGGLSEAEKVTLEDWITAGALVMDRDDCVDTDLPDVDPDESFAYLTASNIVDGIWATVMGSRLTIDHGFARNADQRDMLWYLTENQFLPSGWSLKAVLAKILASNWIARRAPVISQGDSAYEMQPVLDPWIVADPTEVSSPAPHETSNGQGDLVHRMRVNALLRTIAATLGWKEPRAFPGGGYPSPLDVNLGQPLSPGVPGFDGVNFQSLLALESEAGLCNKTGRSVGTDDWIDKLIESIADFNAAHPEAPLTVADAWSALKDRMIQDPTIEISLPSGLVGVAGARTEEQAFLALMNAVASLPGGVARHTPASALAAAELEQGLRQGCGVLVKTPEFLLAMLTPRGYSDNNMPDPPRLSVCLGGESCGYAGTCAYWRTTLATMGQGMTCEDRSVRKSPWLVVWPRPFPDRFVALRWLDFRIATLCRRGLCGFVPRPDLTPCLKTGTDRDCVPLQPWCDPRIDCGVPPPDHFEPGLLVAWAEGGLVREARGVRIRHLGDRGWQTLEEGTRLQSGDLLDVPLSADLLIEREGVTLGSKGVDVRDIEGLTGHVISVAGPSRGRLEKITVVEGAIPPATLLDRVESGRYESRAPTDRDWERVVAYGPKPEGQYTPTPEERAQINADFDALHSMELGLHPDAPEPDLGEAPTEPGPAPVPEDGFPRWLWVLLVLVALAIVLLLVVSRSQQ